MATETKLTLVQRVRTFITEVQAEMAKVTWPTREDLNVSTRVVAMLLVVMAILTFFMDKVFSLVVYGLLSLSAR